MSTNHHNRDKADDVGVGNRYASLSPREQLLGMLMVMLVLLLAILLRSL